MRRSVQGTAESAKPCHGRLRSLYVRTGPRPGLGGEGVTGGGNEADVVSHGRVVDERVGNHVDGLFVWWRRWVVWMDSGSSVRFLESCLFS